MPTRHQSAWRRRQAKDRQTRIMTVVAIPVAAAVVVGAVVAITGSFRTNVSDTALNCASPAAYVVSGAAGKHGHGNGSTATATAMAGTSTATPTTAATSTTAPTTAATSTTAPTTAATTTTAGTATTTATATATPTATATTTTAAPCPTATATTPVVNPEAGTADLALTNPVDPAGNAINLNQSAAQAATSMNCTLTVPANPLSAQGLATPWQLGDGCSMANAGTEGAFVESTILAPNGQLQIYDPLVITQGTTAAVTPTAPTIAAGSQVIINVGFNGNNLVLEGDGATQGNCIDAFGNSIIAQTSACNASAFYADANAQIAAGTLTVPPLGTDSNGQTCESTESFSLIDQDQSDNVVSSYLINGNGQTAQNTAANAAALAGATTVTNGSDDGLLAHFVDQALGCTAFMATDTTSPNGTDASQALNVLSARQNQQGTIALLPVNDPQLLVSGQFSVGKTNTYRALNDQTPLAATTTANANATLAPDVTNSRLTALQGQLTALNQRNATLQSQVTIIQGRGLSAANQAAQIAPVNAQITSVNNQIASVNSQIAALQGQANGSSSSLTAFDMQNAATYCQNMVNIQPAKLQGDMAKELNFTSPVPATGNNLATFMGARLSASFTNLNCQNFGLTNPVTVTVDGNGVATAVTYNTTQQIATVTAATATATPSATSTATATATSTGATASATPAATSTGAPANTQGSPYNTVVPLGRKGHKENAAGM
jgi:hypothetical protein